MSVTASAMVEDAGIRRVRARDPAEMARKFRAARRHSRLIRVLRVAVPATICLCLGVIGFAAFFNPLAMLANIPLDPGKIVVSGSKLSMHSPRLAGYTKDARPYEVTAEVASQDITTPNLMELEKIVSKIEMQDKATVVVYADSGLLDRSNDKLTLRDHIRMTSSSGFEVLLTEAVIGVKSGSLVSTKPATVTFTNGTVNSKGLEVDERGDVIRFTGGVVMDLVMNNPAPKAAR
jgi:lipopolysaccharide export system protein LptC